MQSSTTSDPGNRIVHCTRTYREVAYYNFLILLSLKIDFVIENLADPEEMRHYPGSNFS